MTIKTIEQNILKLSPAKRILVIETILKSLDEPNPQIERAWIIESEKRYSAFKKGKIKAISLDNLKKRIRS